jgi:hypothetical protein
VTPGDDSITLEVSCHIGSDFFLASSLVFDSGFETAHVSGSSERFVCRCPIDPIGDGFGDDCLTCTDLDGDGYGSPGDPSCPAGEQEDCDDHETLSFPGAREIYDAEDNNCDGAIDEGLDDDDDGVPNDYDQCNQTPPGSGVAPDGCAVCGVDNDGDGFIADQDCDDADPAIHPAAAELPGNTVDENCDGALSCDPTLDWGNRGRFAQCVIQACRGLVVTGELTWAECAAIISDRASIDDGLAPTPETSRRESRAVR